MRSFEESKQLISFLTQSTFSLAESFPIADGACLLAEDINWEACTICFTRKKLKSRGTNLKPTLFRFSVEIEALLIRHPATGPLFQYLSTVMAAVSVTSIGSI
jgi:hypothetical protein